MTHTNESPEIPGQFKGLGANTVQYLCAQSIDLRVGGKLLQIRRQLFAQRFQRRHRSTAIVGAPLNTVVERLGVEIVGIDKAGEQHSRKEGLLKAAAFATLR